MQRFIQHLFNTPSACAGVRYVFSKGSDIYPAPKDFGAVAPSKGAGFIFITSLIFLLFLASGVEADSVGEKHNFYVEPDYDLSEREEITAVLAKISSNVYFYIDETWWNSSPKNEIYQSLSELSEEFDSNIYPTLTFTFGPEWNPGIDKDERITVLIHPMKSKAGGYFSSKDQYSKIEAVNSNQREMIYLNADYLNTSYNKSFLAHEFIHLITFNQKNNTYDIAEEVWLNEARAEYAATLMGYDDQYQGSNLEDRVKIFSKDPFNPLTEWRDEREDYGVLNLFIQYLVDHYGVDILVDSLQSPETGIESINYALEENDFEQDFGQIFLDWTIAVLINDCNYGSKYCYLNENLKDIHVSTRTNFLPFIGQSSLTVSDIVRSWTGSWYKVIGGQRDLKLEFFSTSAQYFTVSYITKDKSGNYTIDFFQFNDSQKDEFDIKGFGTDIVSLYIIPLVNKVYKGSFYPFSWTVSIVEDEEESELIQKLLAQIEFLTQEIAKVQSKINVVLASQNQGSQDSQPVPGNQPDQSDQFCQEIKNNLHFGLMSNTEVSCLQEFLKTQGDEIYPAGLVTGNFLSLTREAVIRFQQKYASEILRPLNLDQGTGFVGSKTKTKINEILKALGLSL